MHYRARSRRIPSWSCLCLLCFGALGGLAATPARASEPAPLDALPTVEEVQEKVNGSDPLDTAARRAAVFEVLFSIADGLEKGEHPPELEVRRQRYHNALMTHLGEANALIGKVGPGAEQEALKRKYARADLLSKPLAYALWPHLRELRELNEGQARRRRAAEYTATVQKAARKAEAERQAAAKAAASRSFLDEYLREIKASSRAVMPLDKLRELALPALPVFCLMLLWLLRGTLVSSAVIGPSSAPASPATMSTA